MKASKLFSLIVCLALCGLTYNSFSQEKSIPSIENGTDSQTVAVKSNKTFIGINGGVGMGVTNEYGYDDIYGYYYDYLYLSFSGSVGVDFAFPIGSVFALGPYASIGFENDSFSAGLGALGMFRFKNNCAIMVGEGLNIIPSHRIGTSARLGFKFKNGIYILGEISTSSGSCKHHYSSDNVSLIFHAGFNINN